jgi:hypothetical protein
MGGCGRYLMAAAFALLGAAGAFAQADGGAAPVDDPFDTGAFDTSVQASVKEDKAAAVELLFGGTVVLEDYAATAGPFASWASELKLKAKPFVKVSDPRLGSVFLSYAIVSTIYQTTDDPAAFPPVVAPADLFVPAFTLSEFFVSFDIAKTVFVRAGNQINSWGPGFFWTPVDFINLERANALASLDLRTGVPSLKVHVPFSGSANLFAFVDFRDTVEAGAVRDLFRTVNAALRFDATLGGVEFGLTGYLDAAPGRLVNKYGFDASGALLGFDLYTEQSVSLHYENESDPRAFFDGYAASVGFSRTLDELKEWTCQGEFFYNSEGADGPPVMPFTPFYAGRWYGYLGIAKDKLTAVFTRAELSAVVNFSDLSFFIRAAAVISPVGTLPITVSLTYSGGDEGDEFTSFGVHRLMLTVSAKIVF